MTNHSKVLLWHLVGQEQLVFDLYQSEPIQVKGKDLFSADECVREVWFSPTGFGSKDDAKAVGYIKLPLCVTLNERNSKNYKLAVLSTFVTEPMTKDWDKVFSLPTVSLEHQKQFFPHLFIK